MIPTTGSSFGRAGGRLRRYPGGTENASIFATVRGSIPNRRAASRRLIPSTYTARRTCPYSSTPFIPPPSAHLGRRPSAAGLLLRRGRTTPPLHEGFSLRRFHLVARARIRYAEQEPNIAKLKLRGDDNFALGLSTDQAENFQGYHGKRVLIIADEAPGIEPAIWDAIADIMAGGMVHIVMAGNPTRPSGPFFDAFHLGRGLWNSINIDAFDSPNLRGLTLEKLLQLDSAEGGPLDDNPVPYLVPKRWVYDQYSVWWHGDERSSPVWMSRVRGQFPDQAEDALIKLHWLERAKRRAEEAPVRDTGGRQIAGVDVGIGEAETVVYLCELSKPNSKVLKFGAWRGQDTRGQVVAFLKPYRDRLTQVRVDADGVGHNFGLPARPKIPGRIRARRAPCGKPARVERSKPPLFQPEGPVLSAHRGPAGA
jgi:hypothetical protein